MYGTIIYQLSENGRKDSLVKGGNGKRKQEIHCEIKPEDLELFFVDYDGNARLKIEFRTVDVEMQKDGYGLYSIKNDHREIEFDSVQTAEDLIKWEKERNERIENKLNEFNPKIKALNQEYYKNRKELELKIQEEQKLKDEELRQRKIELEQNKKEWIEKFGSDYLQRAFKLGYDSQRQYVLERVNQELPGFTVDFDDLANWQNRTFPSLKALEIVENLIDKGYDAKIVWLTHPTYEIDESEEDWEKQEAIAITGYLDKYYLVKILN